MTRVACVQCDVAFGDADANITFCVEELGRLAAIGVRIALFPECALTGYCVSSRESALEIAIEPGRLEPIIGASAKSGITVCVGFARRDGDRVYNSAAVVQPNGQLTVYDKTHLPCLGLDRFVTPGEKLVTIDTEHGRLGPLVCFDLRHPEPSRVLALWGTQLMMLPTNWPIGAHAGPDCIAPTRAAENRMFVATCNRIGEENAFAFIGRSGIYDVTGKPLALAGDKAETIIADLNLAEALCKTNVVRAGEYETEVIASRRPELYGPMIG